MNRHEEPVLINLIELGLEEDLRRVLEMQKYDVNEKDDMGNCPILIAAQYNRLSMVKLLIEFNANVDVADVLGRTPIMWANRNHNNEMTEVLQAASYSQDKTQQRPRQS
jgi:ankyrin repeat protein